MLILIDIQEHYLTEFRRQQKNFERMIQAITGRIVRARKNQEPIINQTCFDDGCTLEEILDLIRGYEGTSFLGKEKWDGSHALHEFFCRKELDTSELELVGAFSNVCIRETWIGLKRLGYNLRPINDEMVLRTTRRTEEQEEYPEGFWTRPMDEIELEFGTPKQNKIRLEAMKRFALPKEDEICIFDDGYAYYDVEGPLGEEDMGEEVSTILCG